MPSDEIASLRKKIDRVTKGQRGLLDRRRTDDSSDEIPGPKQRVEEWVRKS